MEKPFRLCVSGSCFIYAMPPELLADAYVLQRTERRRKFDHRLNAMMAGFMRDLMATMNSMPIDAMECYHSTLWDRELILGVIKDNPKVEFWSVHAPFGRYTDPSSPDEGSRRGAIETFCDTVEVAGSLGAKVVVAHPGINVEYDMPRHARLELVVDVMKEVADFAQGFGVKIAVEPLPKNEIGCTLDEVLEIVGGVDRANVGINFDVNHLYPPEQIPSLIRRAGSHIFSVHVSDQDGVERHWLPFEGTLDWCEILAALVDVGYRGPLVYETHIRGAKTCDEVGRAICPNYERLIQLLPQVQ